jgi:hypothetical protein
MRCAGAESLGVPIPGETTLITAALFAGSTHRLNIVWIVVVASAAATHLLSARRTPMRGSLRATATEDGDGQVLSFLMITIRSEGLPFR